MRPFNSTPGWYIKIINRKSRRKPSKWKEIALWISIGLSIASIITVGFTIFLTKTQIKLANQPYLVIGNETIESHNVRLKTQLKKDIRGKLLSLPNIEFNYYLNEMTLHKFDSIPIYNYGNGNAVNVKLTITLNKDSLVKIIKTRCSDSFLDSCLIEKDFIRLPWDESRQVRSAITFNYIHKYDFLAQNSDVTNSIYFNLPYYFYYFKFLQSFMYEENNSLIKIPTLATLEYEDLSGITYHQIYDIDYRFGGGGNESIKSGGGKIIAKQIDVK